MKTNSKKKKLFKFIQKNKAHVFNNTHTNTRIDEKKQTNKQIVDRLDE